MTRRASFTWLPLLLLHLPGGCCLRGLRVVTGSVGGNLSAQCWYEEGFKDNVKYWCRSSPRHPCMTVVKTRESGREARSGRMSIRDDPAKCTFTVTLEDLTEADAGTYYCGIDMPFSIEPQVQVMVSVSPAASANPSAEGTTHSPAPAKIPSAPGWTTETPPETVSPGRNRSSQLSSVHFLPFILLKMLLLLLLLGATIWVRWHRE